MWDSGIFPSKITEGREKKNLSMPFSSPHSVANPPQYWNQVWLLIKRGIRGCLCMNCMPGILHSIFLLSHPWTNLGGTWKPPCSWSWLRSSFLLQGLFSALCWQVHNGKKNTYRAQLRPPPFFFRIGTEELICTQEAGNW